MVRELLCDVLLALTPMAIGSTAADFPVGVTEHTFVRQSATWGSRTLAATIWYPAAEGTFPLVIYSHGGCGGSPRAIAPVALAVARSGFVFVQFPHPGSTADDCVSGGERYTQALVERPDDLVFVIDELQRLNGDASWRLKGVIDAHRVGVIGHSQGGQTALMMPARDPRVKAAFCLSPSVAHPDSPPAVWDAIKAAHVPVMIVHGEQDSSWTNEGPLKAYHALPDDTPRAYLEIAGMGHTPSTQDDVALIVRYTTALFRLYLKDEGSARELLTPAAAPARLSFSSVRLP